MTFFQHPARLFHSNQRHKGKTLDWAGSDTEDLWRKNMSDPFRRTTLERQGWHEPGRITYVYNSEGFRDEEFDDRPCGLAFGCSYTEGTGVDHASAWPRQLTNMTGLYFWNLGVGGGSMDMIYRLFDHYVNRFNPKVVVLCHPPRRRFEFANSDQTFKTVFSGHLEISHPLFVNFFKNYFTYDFNSEINFEKNLRLLEYASKERGLPFFHAPIVSDSLARDLMHSSPGSLQQWAENIAAIIKNKY